MKLNRETDVLEIDSGNIAEDASGKSGINEAKLSKLYKMLSNQYKNSIGAIVREYVSNSWDANKDVDNGLPIEVSIKENYNTPSYFSTRDYGTGMSPEFMREVYFNYLDSTKEDSDIDIGGFGIGAKSWFSYGNEVFITSNHEGTKYEWVFNKDEDGNPAYTLLNEIPMEEGEQTGVKIFGYIKDGDEFNFKEEVKKQLPYLNNIYFKDDLTNLNNFKIFEGKHFKYSTINSRNTLHMLIGNIPYDIDFQEINPIYNLHIPIGVKFDVSELSPLPSRETIEYSKRAKQLIEQRIEETLDELAKLYNDKIDEVTTLESYIEAVNSAQNKLYFDKEKGIWISLYEIKDRLKSVKFEPLDKLDLKISSGNTSYRGVLDAVLKSFCKVSYGYIPTLQSTGLMVVANKDYYLERYNSEIYDKPTIEVKNKFSYHSSYNIISTISELNLKKNEDKLKERIYKFYAWVFKELIKPKLDFTPTIPTIKFIKKEKNKIERKYVSRSASLINIKNCFNSGSINLTKDEIKKKYKKRGFIVDKNDYKDNFRRELNGVANFLNVPIIPVSKTNVSKVKEILSHYIIVDSSSLKDNNKKFEFLFKYYPKKIYNAILVKCFTNENTFYLTNLGSLKNYQYYPFHLGWSSEELEKFLDDNKYFNYEDYVLYKDAKYIKENLFEISDRNFYSGNDYKIPHLLFKHLRKDKIFRKHLKQEFKECPGLQVELDRLGMTLEKFKKKINDYLTTEERNLILKYKI